MQFYAEDIMSGNLITVRPELTIDEAIDLFTNNRITGAPVVNDQGVLIGEVSLTDLLRASQNLPEGVTGFYSQDELDERFGDTGFHIEQAEGFISDVMQRQVQTVQPHTPIEDVCRTMFQNRIHRVIVLQPNEQKPVGIVSTFDLLKLLADMYSTAEFTPREQGRVEAEAKSRQRGEPIAYRQTP